MPRIVHSSLYLDSPCSHSFPSPWTPGARCFCLLVSTGLPPPCFQHWTSSSATPCSPRPDCLLSAQGRSAPGSGAPWPSPRRETANWRAWRSRPVSTRCAPAFPPLFLPSLRCPLTLPSREVTRSFQSTPGHGCVMLTSGVGAEEAGSSFLSRN